MAANERESTQIRNRIRVHLRSFAAILFLLAASVACAQPKQTVASQELAAILKAITASQIGMIEILQMPPDIETRSQVSPEDFEKSYYYYKIVIRDVRDFQRWPEMVDALRSTSVQPHDFGADVRWGVVFYVRDSSARLGVVYLDRNGAYGYVNKSVVLFTGGFFQFLDKTFSPMFGSMRPGKK